MWAHPRAVSKNVQKDISSRTEVINSLANCRRTHACMYAWTWINLEVSPPRWGQHKIWITNMISASSIPRTLRGRRNFSYLSRYLHNLIGSDLKILGVVKFQKNMSYYKIQDLLMFGSASCKTKDSALHVRYLTQLLTQWYGKLDKICNIDARTLKFGIKHL